MAMAPLVNEDDNVWQRNVFAGHVLMTVGKTSRRLRGGFDDSDDDDNGDNYHNEDDDVNHVDNDYDDKDDDDDT